jgi:ankyrin repeat protein
VTYLLNHDVEVNLVGGEFGTALRAAIAMEHESIVEGLLLAGADANIDAPAIHTLRDSGNSREFKSTMEVVVASCNTKVLQVMLDHGMILYPQYLEDALEHVVNANIEPDKQLKMIDFLVSKGVDVRTHGGKAAVSACGRHDNPDIVRKFVSLGTPFETAVDEASWQDSGLIHAVDYGRRDVIEMLLNAGADVNFGSCKNESVLDRAIEKGDKDLAVYLLDKGANPNIKAGQWGTPFMKAIRKGDDEMFHELLRRGAEVNITHGYWGTPLQTAIQFDYYHLAHELLDRGADPKAPGIHVTALTTASGYGKAGQVDLFKRLMDFDFDLDAFDVERPEDYISGIGNRWYSNALQNAAMAGNETTAKLLLDNGANVNALGGTNGTALQFAAKEGQENMVMLLLERGADINRAGGELCTALQAAAREGRLTLVQLLLENGADVNIEGGKFGSALQAACSISSTRIVKELLARGANVNTYCGMYGSPLQAAASRGAVEIVKALVESGADVQLGGGQYGCALQAAACSNQFQQNHLDVMKILLEHGANVNGEGGEFGTALQAAAYHHRLYVELLLKHGADPRIKGGKYGTAVGAAKEKGRSRLVKLLEERTRGDV